MRCGLERSHLVAVLGVVALLGGIVVPVTRAPANEARLIEVKVGIGTLSSAEQRDLWQRVDQWAQADSLLEFCGRRLNVYKRGWNAVTACVDTASLRKVGFAFRTKKADYLKVLEASYADPEKKKVFCDGLTTQLKEYTRIINAQIAEADGMCRACLWC